MKVFALIKIGWLIIVFGCATTATAKDISSLLNQCSLISSNSERLHCYDQLSIKTSAGQNNEPDISTSVQLTDTIKAAEPDKRVINKGRWLNIEPYRRNYILPVTFNENVNQDLYTGPGEQFKSDDTEIKFQLSFQLPVWENIFATDLDLYIAYTQLSFFQVYNDEYSRPFRETVYEPELGLRWEPDFKFADWTLESLRLSYNHQSNGRSKPLSRSWDRVIGQLKFSNDELGLGIRLWQRVDAVPLDDDNPDIDDYMGNGELFASYDMGKHRLGLMLRNPFEYEAYQVDWTYLFSEKVGLYLQYYHGYGESLLDYDHRVDRIGIGFMLNEWL